MALAIFALTYLVLSGVKIPGLKLDRPGAALVGAAAMIAVGVVAPAEVQAALDLDTLVLLLGMMLLCAYLARASFFPATAHFVLRKARSARALMVLLVFVSGVLSAVLVNDTVCLMLTPLVLELVRRAQLPPRPYLFALCMAANAGSVATFTGNPQNMIIGVASHLSYGRFLAFMTLPALASLLVVVAVILYACRAELPDGPLVAVDHTPPPVDRPLIFKSTIVLTAVVIAFFAGLPMAWSALVGSAVLVLIARVDPEPQLKDVNYPLLVFFASLFVLVHGVNHEGWALEMRKAFAPLMAGGAGARDLRLHGAHPGRVEPVLERALRDPRARLGPGVVSARAGLAAPRAGLDAGWKPHAHRLGGEPDRLRERQGDGEGRLLGLREAGGPHDADFARGRRGDLAPGATAGQLNCGWLRTCCSSSVVSSPPCGPGADERFHRSNQR